MAIPVALEYFVGIVSSLVTKEFRHLRVAGEHLVLAGPFVIGEEVAAIELYGEVDEVTKRVDGLFFCRLWCVRPAS